jgi:hypothetical protein
MFCSGLKNKSHCFYNEQLTEEEYHERVAVLHLDSYSGLCDAKKRFFTFDVNIPKRFSQTSNCEDSVGDYLKYCKNCYYCFDIGSSEDCRYCTDAMSGTMDAMDCTAVTASCSVNYESNSCTESSFLRFCNYVRNSSSHIDYGDLIISSNDLYGCVGLKKSHHCIFNKQYSEGEYQNLRLRIIAHMKETSEFGEFFPAAHSPYGYNETLGNDVERVSAEQAKEMELNWNEKQRGTFGKETMKIEDIPDSVKHVDDEILNAILPCMTCSKDYKLIRQELEFYRKKGIPIPRECFDCRNYRRMQLFNPRHLWHRQCMCTRAEHGHRAVVVPELQRRRTEAGNRCSTEFETTYAPDRPEPVYCESCYQKEII